MIDSNFSSFVAYFRQLAAASRYFKFFECGGAGKILDERLVSATRSAISYPLLFLEWPEIPVSSFSTANTQLTFTSAFAILDDAPKDDWSLTDEKMDSALSAALQVLIRMHQDNTGLQKKFFFFDLSKVLIMPVDNYFTDAAFGWRVEFSISVMFNMCADPGFWK